MNWKTLALIAFVTAFTVTFVIPKFFFDECNFSERNIKTFLENANTVYEQNYSDTDLRRYFKNNECVYNFTVEEDYDSELKKFKANWKTEDYKVVYQHELH